MKHRLLSSSPASEYPPEKAENTAPEMYKEIKHRRRRKSWRGWEKKSGCSSLARSSPELWSLQNVLSSLWWRLE